jgi:hypothetical protein
MKRSGDVTAAAIILFFGSGLLVLLMLLAVLGAVTTQMPPEARYGEFLGFGFYVVFAAWGIANGVGLLQLRPWARISMIVMSVGAIFFSFFGAIGLMLVPRIVAQSADVPPGAGVVVAIVGTAMLLVPLAIAIWWLVLFTRERVVVEFATGSAAQSSLASAELPPTISPTPSQFVTAPAMPGIPLSIRSSRYSFSSAAE